MEKVTILSLDVGGTLLQSTQLGICGFVSQKMGRPVSEIRKALEIAFLTCDCTVSYAAETFLRELGLPKDSDLLNGYSSPEAELYPDVLPTIADLHNAGFRIITLSNCASWEATNLQHFGLGRVIESSFHSYSVGYAKPHPQIFRAAERALLASSASFVHIGDSWNADILGAINAGWKAVYLSRHSKRPEYVPPGLLGTITTLKQLPQLLCATPL
jgi:HAD superfamily hydrolase (TIGR01549 family)